jgi:excisionase family DNA binding protein
MGRLLEGQEGMVTRRLLTIHEVAEYTGLSVHTLYTMVSQRRIPFIKVGRLTKFDRTLLDEWLAKHTVMPIALKRA